MIGRSGLDKEPARRLVKDLEDAGAFVHVTRGDVGDVTGVEKAVAAIEGEIGGVVQAAMGLDVCLLLHCDVSFISVVALVMLPSLSSVNQHDAYFTFTNRKRSGLLCPTSPGTPL